MYSITLLKPHAEALLLWLNEQGEADKSQINKGYFRVDSNEHTITLSLKYAITDLSAAEHESLSMFRGIPIIEDYPFTSTNIKNTAYRFYSHKIELIFKTSDDDISIDWENQLERFYTYQLLKLIE